MTKFNQIHQYTGREYLQMMDNCGVGERYHIHVGADGSLNLESGQESAAFDGGSSNGGTLCDPETYGRLETNAHHHGMGLF